MFGLFGGLRIFALLGVAAVVGYFVWDYTSTKALVEELRVKNKSLTHNLKVCRSNNKLLKDTTKILDNRNNEKEVSLTEACKRLQRIEKETDDEKALKDLLDNLPNTP